MKARSSAAMNPRYVILAGGTLVAGSLVIMSAARSALPTKQADEFVATVITTGLDTPWDLVWGPDDMIWVSERGGRISRIDPATGRRTTAGEPVGVVQRGESGLMGIALHPDFPRQPWMYVMYSYDSGGVRNRLARLRWAGSRFDSQENLFNDLPGGFVHNGSRVVVGKDRNLYFSTGDAGAQAEAQDPRALNGKIMRLDLDGRVPAGNPFNTPIWSWGHRNPQGLVAHPRTGVLYETEHGAGDNDEVNIVEAGRNYGWPNVRGACDENDAERAYCRDKRVVEPLTSWTPTVAISGADLYLSDRMPRLRNSLLAASLNGRTLWRMKLSPDGRSIVEREALLTGIYGRLRDVLVAPNGDIYICTSNRDGRGSPADGDDRIIRLSPKH